MGTLIAVTGATAYIGGRPVPRLLAAGHTVRVLTRDASKLRDVPWGRAIFVPHGLAVVPFHGVIFEGMASRIAAAAEAAPPRPAGDTPSAAYTRVATEGVRA